MSLPSTPKKNIDFYFDYLSPWAYFGWLQLNELIKTHDVTVSLCPVAYPKLCELWKQRAIGTIEPKRLFAFKFARRHALRNSIPFELPKVHPYRPYTSLRLSLKEIAGERQFEVVDALFQACWQKKVDMGSDDAICAFLNRSGFDGTRLLARTKEEPVKKKLTEIVESAVRLGVFGVPTLIIDRELFWGNDQFEDIKDFLAGKDLLKQLPKDEPFLPPHSWGLGDEKKQETMVTGVAHTILSVGNFDLCKPFYKKLLTFMGFVQVFEGKETIYYVGGKTALGIGQCEEKFRGARFRRGSIGLHHLCFRARNREEIDRLYHFLKEQNATIIHPPEDGPWAPGYYSVLFEDPDGIRLEVNHVPGKGLLEEGARFNAAGYYR